MLASYQPGGPGGVGRYGVPTPEGSRTVRCTYLPRMGRTPEVQDGSNGAEGAPGQ